MNQQVCNFGTDGHLFGILTTPDEEVRVEGAPIALILNCLLYTSPSPRDLSTSRMPSSA